MGVVFPKVGLITSDPKMPNVQGPGRDHIPNSAHFISAAQEPEPDAVEIWRSEQRLDGNPKHILLMGTGRQYSIAKGYITIYDAGTNAADNSFFRVYDSDQLRPVQYRDYM